MNASGRLSRENSDVQMEIGYTREKISLDKELNSLDKLVIDFTSILNKLKVKYVIVFGYVSILFGRSRASEDVDLIIEKLGPERFKKFWDAVSQRFECVITGKADDAYKDYLLQQTAVRFARRGEFVPTMELKFPKREIDLWTLNNRRTVILNNHRFFISPLELQIPYKLLLGSEKDLEDAQHLYELFKGRLDIRLLMRFSKRLKVEDAYNEHLR